MRKLASLATAALFASASGRAAGEELLLTWVWDRGGQFYLQIGSGVIRNGHTVSKAVSMSGYAIAWHETSPAATDYEYNIDRRTGVFIASTFSKLFDRTVENRGLCVKAGSSAEVGF
ncbi:MAG: hypothetical protein ACLQKK_01420 [Rhodomicrobium sp.]